MRSLPKLEYQVVPGTRVGFAIGVPGGTGFRDRIGLFGTRWYRVPDLVPKSGYQGVPGTGLSSEIGVPGGTGYRLFSVLCRPLVSTSIFPSKKAD